MLGPRRLVRGAARRGAARRVYASKVSYGVTSEADEPAMGWYTRAAHAHARLGGMVLSPWPWLAYTYRYVIRVEGAPPPPPSGAQELICGSGKRNRSNNIPYYDVTRDTGSRVRVSRAYRADHAPVPCT